MLIIIEFIYLINYNIKIIYNYYLDSIPYISMANLI